MANIEKRGRKYRVCWRSPYGKRCSRYCPDKATARKIQREVEQALAEGRNWEPDRVRPEPTNEELMKGYLRDIARSRQASSVRRYAGNLDLALRWLQEVTGDPQGGRPSIMSKMLLGEFYDHLLSSGLKGRRQPATAKKIVEVLERMWIWAANEDEHDGFIPAPKRLDMPEAAGDPVRAPTWAMMDACIAAASGWIRKLALLLRFTGLRVQQAMHLKWDDFDMEACTLRIRGELGKTRHERKGRIIPVSKYLVAEMGKWEHQQDYVVPCQRMQDGPRGREAKGRDMSRAWKRANIKEEIWKQRPHHAFRKGFKTELTRAGARWEAVEHLLGHQVGDSVTSRYLDPEFLPLREAVKLIPPLGQHLKVVNEEEEVG